MTEPDELESCKVIEDNIGEIPANCYSDFSRKENQTNLLQCSTRKNTASTKKNS